MCWQSGGVVLVVRFTSLWFGVFWGRHGIQFEFVGHCFSASYYFFFFLFSVPRRSVRIMHCAYRNTPKRPQTKAKWTAPPTPPRLIANTLEMSNLA